MVRARWRGGPTTKIAALDDALGNLFDLVLLPGQAQDLKGVAPLLEGVAFDADWLLAELDMRGASAVIPPQANRKIKRDCDRHTYKWRHLIESFLARIKEFRAIATRYETTACSYIANWHLVATIIAAK